MQLTDEQRAKRKRYDGKIIDGCTCFAPAEASVTPGERIDDVAASVTLGEQIDDVAAKIQEASADKELIDLMNPMAVLAFQHLSAAGMAAVAAARSAWDVLVEARLLETKIGPGEVSHSDIVAAVMVMSARTEYAKANSYWLSLKTYVDWAAEERTAKEGG